MRRLWTVLAALATLSLTNCGYNAIQTNDEQVKSAWSEVLNQYQRRADLVPNLVNSVKGFAQQEKDVLLGVTNARAKVGSIQATPELINDPGAFAKFQAAQGELSSALSKLLVVTENYPQLKSDALFRDLMAQLEGTENRITVARNRYIKSVQDYNVGIRTFPNNLTAMMFGYKEKSNFSVENAKEISVAPKVDFNPAPAAPSKYPIVLANNKNLAGMNAARAILLALLLGWIFPGLSPALADVAVPPLVGRVVDQTGTLSSSELDSLQQTLRAFEARKGSQIAVLIVPTTAPETIEQYSLRVAEAWKIGRKRIDDGAILVVAKNDHRLRIEVGYGLEGALTDITSKRIIDEIITPRFRNGDFAGGISAGVDRIIRVIDGEKLPAPELPHRQGSTMSFDPTDLFNPFLIIPVLLFGGVMRTMLGRLLGSAAA